jgi:hypothetical protein
MKSAPKARRARDSVTRKPAKSALVIPEAGRCNGTELRRATRGVSLFWLLAACARRSGLYLRRSRAQEDQVWGNLPVLS